MPLLMLGYLSAFIDRSNIGFAKLQFLAELNLSETVFGIGGGLFYLGYCLFEVPSNLLLAKVGARNTFLRIMILWSLCSTAMAFVSSASQFYLLRFLLGAAEAGFFPGVLFYLSQWAPPSRRARLTAMFMSAMTLSGIIGGPLAGAVMQNLDGVHGLAGWQWLFIVEGLPGIFIAALTFWLLPDGPADANWLTDTEKRAIANELRSTAVKVSPAPGQAIWSVLRDSRLYALGAMSVALIAGIGGLSLWLPTVIRNAGVSSVLNVGLLASLPYLLAVVVQQLVARHSDARGERRWHTATLMTIAAIGWISMPAVAGNVPLSIGVLVLTACGLFGATGPFWSLPAACFRGTAAAVGIAMVTTLGGIASFVSPILVGWATSATGSLATGQYYYGALAIIGALALLLGIRQADHER